MNRVKKPSKEDQFIYLLYHTNDDFPMDRTLEEYYEKVCEFRKEYDKWYTKEVSERLP